MVRYDFRPKQKRASPYLLDSHTSKNDLLYENRNCRVPNIAKPIHNWGMADTFLATSI